MKTVVKEEGINLEKIEKTTDQILKKINGLRSNLFDKTLKFSKKAKEEKMFLFKNLIPKRILVIENTIELLNKILIHPNFSKLEKEDLDFISGLETMGFKDSHYAREINDFITKEASEGAFMAVMEENIYFTLLNSELNSIEAKLLRIL